MDNSRSDVDLMLRFQKGDEGAFTDLVERHQRSVLNLVRRFVGPSADAEDLAQEIFVRLYLARASYRPSAKFTTFLYRNTLNLCLNHIRDRSRRNTIPLDPSGGERDARSDPPDPGAGDPADEVIGGERAEAVRRAVAELPENQRIATLLSRWEGLSYEEIADTMEISVMAVRSLLSRARENLRARLCVLLKDDEAVRHARD